MTVWFWTVTQRIALGGVTIQSSSKSLLQLISAFTNEVLLNNTPKHH